MISRHEAKTAREALRTSSQIQMSLRSALRDIETHPLVPCVQETVACNH